MKWRLVPALMAAVSIPLLAEDTALATLRSTLYELSNHSQEHLDTRGATPQLTTAKHLLRDWIESRLAKFDWKDDEAIFANRLNHDIEEASLFCGAHCDNDEDASGSLWKIELQKKQNGLLVKTRVGILCGFDESAYLYEWRRPAWRRIWQSEQDVYTVNGYKPQTIQDVLVSPLYPKDDHQLVLTLGFNPWCSSAWHSVYYRLWRLPTDGAEPKLLIDRTEAAFLGGNPIQGSIGPNGALIEFRTGSIDVGVHNRPAVRNYAVQGTTVRRIDPLALSPRDFVEEWLTQPWSNSGNRSEEPDRTSLHDWHQKLHRDYISGEFEDPTLHCHSSPDLWQVGISGLDKARPEESLYFLVRWQPPYRFSLARVSNHPSPECTEPDRQADEEHTLFPIAEHH